MQNVKKRKTKTGAIVFAVFLILWVIALGAGIYYLWNSVRVFGGYWEKSQINPKIDAYMDRLSAEMWEGGENSVVKTISEMEHPYQTDEECMDVLKTILKDDLRCLPGVSDTQSNKRVFNLLSGRSKFGQITATQYPFEPEENKLVNYVIKEYSVYPWEVDGVEFYLDGLYTTFDITVPASYTVLLNGHPLTGDNIVERDIRYNVLEDYYDEFEGLPTKVKYHAEKIFGQVDCQLLDANGNPTSIDPEQDDSQFIEPVSQELEARFANFAEEFTKRYLQFCAGTGDMWYEYNLLQHFVLKDSDLSERLYKMIDSYLGWQHNSNFNFNGCTLNSVTSLGNDIYVLDISSDSGSQMPARYVKVHRDMKVYIKYFPDKDEAFAFSAEDYNTEESDFIG